MSPLSEEWSCLRPLTTVAHVPGRFHTAASLLISVSVIEACTFPPGSANRTWTRHCVRRGNRKRAYCKFLSGRWVVSVTRDRPRGLICDRPHLNLQQPRLDPAGRSCNRQVAEASPQKLSPVTGVTSSKSLRVATLVTADCLFVGMAERSASWWRCR